MADKLLNQADIDAILAGISAQAYPAAPAAAPAMPSSQPVMRVETPKATPHPVSQPGASPDSQAARSAVPPTSAPTVNNEAIKQLNAKVDNLAKQLSQVTSIIARIDEIEKKVNQIATKTSSDAATQKYVQMVADELKKTLTKLQGTPGYGIHQDFTCDKCNSHGTVAARFRCTSCGTETWRGWWPKK